MTTVTTNFQYQSNRSTTQKYSVELKLIYAASVTMKIASTEVQSLTPCKQQWQEKLPFRRKKPWAEQGSYGTLLLMSRGELGDTGQERRTQGGQEQTLTSNRTLLFRLLWGYLGFQDCAVEGAGPSLVQKIKLQRPQRGCNNNKHNHTLQHNFHKWNCEFSPPPNTELSFILHAFVCF